MGLWPQYLGLPWLALASVAFAQPRFDVAAIKPPNAQSPYQRPLISGGQLLAENVALRRLIEEAYGILPMQLTNVPAWVDAEKWWVQAKAEESATPAQVQLMLRTLLAERFQLRVRVEKQEQSYFALTVRAAARARDRMKEGGAQRPVRVTSIGDTTISNKFTNYSMFALARDLSAEVERVVMDETKLTGTFGFEFEGLRDRSEANPFSQQRIAPLVGELGLRLESKKGPVEVYVIDGVQRPSEN